MRSLSTSLLFVMLPNRDFTVGNTITVGVAIYKQNWRQYLKLSFIAHLWLLVPVYGWARYFAIAAWISRLSFQKLVNDANRLSRKQYLTANSLFKLLVIAISSIFIPLILSNIVMIPLTIIVPVIYKIILQFPSFADFIFQNNFYLLGYFALFVCYGIWILIYARLFITELAFADYLINKVAYPYPINRSYHLTKNNTFKIYKVIWLSFFCSIPVWIVLFITICAVFIAFRLIIPRSILDSNSLYLPILPTFILCAHMIVLPFWQSVKALVFYQLTKNSNNESIR